jgi:hypothetical protein
MYPTGWGWLTIGSGLAMLAALVYWRFRHPGQWWAVSMFVLMLLLFLYSFMQWASWYK